MKSILIAGLAKTGTTGVYTSFKDAVANLPHDYALLFEPTKPDAIRALGRYAPQRPILTKVMVHRMAACEVRFGDWDRRIMTVRDPRDVVISRLLFRPLNRGSVRRVSPEELKPFTDALREKEADPSSHSVKGLNDLADRLEISKSGWDHMTRSMDLVTEIATTNDFFMLRYEDFVDNKLSELSDHVGFAVDNPASTEVGWLSHIPRSMGYGDWKNWFLDEDIEFFGSLFRPFLERYGYTDWDLPPDQKIDPSTSSEYVERKVAERAREVQDRYTGEWTVDSVTSEEQLDHLRSMAGDGDAISCHRLALIYLAGGVVAADRQAGLAWAREAAIRGHADAMTLLADSLTNLDIDQDPEAVLEGRFWAREAAEVARVDAMTRRLERIERTKQEKKAATAAGDERRAGTEKPGRRGLGRLRRG